MKVSISRVSLTSLSEVNPVDDDDDEDAKGGDDVNGDGVRDKGDRTLIRRV